jgi:transposase-like protein
MFSGGIIIMKPTAKRKHIRYSAVEKASLLEAYKTSGTLKRHWCKESGIAPSTLHKWLGEEKKQEQPPNPNVQAWVPIVTIPSGVSPAKRAKRTLRIFRVKRSRFPVR